MTDASHTDTSHTDTSDTDTSHTLVSKKDSIILFADLHTPCNCYNIIRSYGYCKFYYP